MSLRQNALFENGKWSCCIVQPSKPGTVEGFAISELKKYLDMMAGKSISVKKKSSDAAIKVGVEFSDSIPEARSLTSNGFVINTLGDDIIIAASDEKGVLNGVYEFLEILGCRWYSPGPHGEFVPKKDRVRVRVFQKQKAPSFPTITFFQDTNTLRDYSDKDARKIQEQNDRDLIDWMGKSKMNRLMGTILDGTAEAQKELEKRGIRREFGGHVIPQLLPRDLFDENPTYFPIDKNGKRNPNGNVCCSNISALKIIQENAAKMIEENEGDVLHVWGHDAKEGYWCRCQDCEDLSVQDQYMVVVNAVAKAAAEIRPGLRVTYIAYYDTLFPALSVKPRDNVMLLFAPRSRCYGDSLSDPRCKTNSYIYRGLKRYMSIFGRGNAATFEYYGDSLLFCSAAASIPWIIARDLHAYRDAGIVEAGCLMFGGYSWWAHPLNQYAFAKAAFNTRTRVNDLIRDYVSHRFPNARVEMYEYFRDLEYAVGRLLKISDWRYVVDRGTTTDRFLIRITDNIGVIEGLIARLEGLMAIGSKEDKDEIQKERDLLETTLLFAKSYKSQILGHVKGTRKQRGRVKHSAPYEAYGHLDAAEQNLNDMVAHLKRVDSSLRGSWGYEGQGELKRINDRLLSEMKSKKDRIRKRTGKGEA